MIDISAATRLIDTLLRFKIDFKIQLLRTYVILSLPFNIAVLFTVLVYK